MEKKVNLKLPLRLERKTDENDEHRKTLKEAI
jgi:hypothetical protein